VSFIRRLDKISGSDEHEALIEDDKRPRFSFQPLTEKSFDGWL